MALLKKAAAVAEPFVVPSLAEAEPEVYGKLIEKRAELNQRVGEASSAASLAASELAADTSKEVRPAVAALLGDGQSAKSLKRRALAEARQLESDIEVAITEVERRIRDAKTPALRAVIARVRPEWEKRTKALCEALDVVKAAHVNLDDLRLALEAEDVSSDHIGPRPFFLGDARDGKIAAYFKEVGYGA